MRLDSKKLGQIYLLAVVLTNASCAINFEITSQRTALENQMLGTYQDTDRELYVISSVRSLDKQAQGEVSVADKAKLARQNQIFNQDDIDELKNLQIIGETDDGDLKLLPGNIGLAAKATADQNSLANLMVTEENHDREIIWQHTIASNENLKPTDLDKVRRTYAAQMLKNAKPGQWFFASGSGWYQKTGETPKSDK